MVRLASALAKQYLFWIKAH